MKKDTLILDTNRIIGIYASQNYGKTYLTSNLVNIISEHTNVFIFDTNFERLSKYPQNKKNIKFIKAANIINQSSVEFLNEALLYLRSKNNANFYIVIEDIDKIVENAHKSKKIIELFNLASDSRHQRIGIIYITKEPVNIPVKLRSNTNLFFIGSYIEPAHVKTLSAIVDKKLLKSLVKPEFIMFDRYNSRVNKVIIKNDKLVAL